jgi:hypothetical protein
MSATRRSPVEGELSSSSSSFLLGLGPVCLYQSSSDVDVQLPCHKKSVRYPRPGLQFLVHLFSFPVGRSPAFPTNPPSLIRAWDRHWQLQSYSIHPAPTRGVVEGEPMTTDLPCSLQHYSGQRNLRKFSS